MKKTHYFLLITFLLTQSFLFGQSFEWLKTGYRPDCSNGVYPRDVTSSPNGSITSTGYFYAPSTNINFDGLTLTQNGTGFSSDVFIANYNSSGTIQWLKSIGTNQSDGTYPRIDTDINDNIYVATDIAGTTGGVTGNVAGTSLPNVYPNDAVITKLSSTGNPLWIQHITDPNGDVHIRDIDVDDAGNIYVTGSFEGSITVDGTTQTADGLNVFLAKFATNGNLVWWENSTGANADIGYRVHQKGSNVYVLGQMAQGNANTTMTIGGTTETLPVGEDRSHFLLKYTDAGTLTWFRYGYLENTGFGSGIFPYYCDIAVDASDNVYTIHTATAESQASATYNYGGSTVTYNTVANTSGGGESNYIISKYNSSGAVQWARGDGSSTAGAVLPTQMILHSDGNLIVTNLISGTTEIDDVSFTSAGSEDIVLAQFDLNAQLVCHGQYGGANQDWAMALDENPDGTCAYAGHVFGGTSASTITSYDGINMTGCRNTGVTGSFSTKAVNAEFSFVTYPSAEVCQPNSNGLILSASPSGFTKTFISSPAGLSINSSSGEIDVNASSPGVYTVSHILTDGTVCGTDTVSKTFTINESPTSNAGTNFSVCDNTATLNGNTPSSGSGVWSIISGPSGGSISNPNSSNTSVTGLTEGSYTFQWEVTNSCGSVSDNVIVTMDETPVVNGGADQEVCEGEEVTLVATTSTGTISWNNGVDNGVPFAPATTTTYTVTADNNGCTDTDEVIVTVNALPAVEAGPDVTTCVNYEPIQLTGSPVSGVYSGPSISGNEFDPSIGAGTYTITYVYTDANGCEASDDLTITVDGCASIDENNISNGVTVMPNPATDFIDVVIEGTKEIESIQLISSEGKLISIRASAVNTSTKRIDVSSLSKGTYIIHIKLTDDLITRKVIVQ